MSISRFELEQNPPFGGQLRHSPDGYWVTYEDYTTLRAEADGHMQTIDEQAERIKELKDELDRMIQSRDDWRDMAQRKD